MNIKIERGKIYSLEDLPRFSVALDGAVLGPAIDPESHRYSFDHHSECLRFCTTSACMQTHMGILLGLDPSKYTIFINDVDIDVCMAIWCLRNPERCNEPIVRKLVDAVGLLDMHAGAIAVNGMAKVVEWISAPQTDSIRNGDYSKLSNDGLRPILESILHRIDRYVNGDAAIDIADQELHGEYEIKRNDPNGWVLVSSKDPHVYSALYRAGFDRIVLIRPQEDGSNAIALAKRSDFIDKFPLEKMYKEFNKLEPGWGGSSSIGGSPRNRDGSRSKLTLEVIIEVVNSTIENRTPQIENETS